MRKLLQILLCLIVSALVFSSCKSESQTQHEEEVDEKRLKLSEQKIDKIMEMMDLPEYGLVKLSREGEYLSKDYQQAANEMLKWGRQMKGIYYPDKDFQKFNTEMLAAFDVFEAALKTKNKDKIAGAWKVVAKSCKDCHDMFD